MDKIYKNSCRIHKNSANYINVIENAHHVGENANIDSGCPDIIIP